MEYRKLEICLNGLLNGLTIKEVEVYAKKELCSEQMKEIYLGLINGLSVKQAEAYASEYLTPLRMKKIREVMLEMKKK